jgi:cell division protein FtsB
MLAGAGAELLYRIQRRQQQQQQQQREYSKMSSARAELQSKVHQ